MLWLGFHAFDVHTNFRLLIAGYTVGTLLNIVSVTPAGIGFAEGGMTAVFVALGVPLEEALLVTLLYRTAVVLYTVGVSMVAIHFVPGLTGKTKASSV
jgi:uncharacterized protein (TIRG00374 family)